ncbi:hypothetical protein LINPERHAP1_LOCUS7617, partial [Linum perenne]
FHVWIQKKPEMQVPTMTTPETDNIGRLMEHDMQRRAMAFGVS